MNKLKAFMITPLILRLGQMLASIYSGSSDKQYSIASFYLSLCFTVNKYFMSFAGHVLDMISRMKQNEALKSNRRNKYKKIKDAYFEEIGSYQGINNLTKQKLSKEELLIVKKRIKARLKLERKRSFILTMVFVILACTVLAFLIYNRLKLHM